MPVTAKLSRKFYEKFGDDIANELVEWFNAVDATYKADLRELNELNFQRFDAKLEQRMAELRADLAKGIAELRAELLVHMADLRVDVRTALGQSEKRLLRWMFGFWTATFVPLVGLSVTLIVLLR